MPATLLTRVQIPATAPTSSHLSLALYLGESWDVAERILDNEFANTIESILRLYDDVDLVFDSVMQYV